MRPVSVSQASFHQAERFAHCQVDNRAGSMAVRQMELRVFHVSVTGIWCTASIPEGRRPPNGKKAASSGATQRARDGSSSHVTTQKTELCHRPRSSGFTIRRTRRG